MADMVNKLLYAELAKKNTADVVMPPFCEYSEEERCYVVTAWNGKFAVYPERAAVRALSGTEEPHDYFYVFLINYLLAAKKTEPAGCWISEKDLAGGATFFRGPHKIPTELISSTYGNDLARLRQKCTSFDGTPLDMADCAFAFTIVGSIRVALLYWVGDEDFAPEAKLLLDQTVADSLRLDVIFGLLCDVCVRLAKEDRTDV